MEALIASYGDTSSDSDSENSAAPTTNDAQNSDPKDDTVSLLLPPPPLSLLGTTDYLESGQASRVRSFPHVEGNYALHIYIPVYIPSASKKEMGQFLKKVAAAMPGLHVVDVDIPLNNLCKDDHNLQQVAFGREFHISLGRTVPIRVHQIDSMVSMLRQKFQSQKRYWIDFNKWEVFINDEHTRSFVSIEVVTGGLPEITKQIEAVNEVYKLHNLPEFYQDPRPHISLAWASGDISNSLKRVIAEEIKRSNVGCLIQNRIFTSKFSGIDCRIGNKTYKICKFSDD